MQLLFTLRAANICIHVLICVTPDNLPFLICQQQVVCVILGGWREYNTCCTVPLPYCFSESFLECSCCALNWKNSGEWNLPAPGSQVWPWIPVSLFDLQYYILTQSRLELVRNAIVKPHSWRYKFIQRCIPTGALPKLFHLPVVSTPMKNVVWVLPRLLPNVSLKKVTFFTWGSTGDWIHEIVFCTLQYSIVLTSTISVYWAGMKWL